MQKTKHQTKPKRHITFQLTRKQINYNQVRDENTKQTNQSYLFNLRNFKENFRNGKEVDSTMFGLKFEINIKR